ncbi:GTPase-activating protein gyp8 [Knufia obscura]|uniref:GTPase-activating protein gyp8 n=1 Tax=Knufia obscura TaxID=1635080 RepID=A0ABR0RTR2_9EURO|nr:GTPase-activating protein gyp8 [Knufia obscura]
MEEKQFDLSDKRGAIGTACQAGDIEALVNLASSAGGLLDDDFRATAWPLLLGCTDRDAEEVVGGKWQDLPQHPDEEQVQKDVDRAFVYYPSNETQQSMQHKRTDLFELITSVLRGNPMLHYFQGYHDIVQVFLLVLGKEAALPAVSRISLLRIRDYMLSSLSPGLKQLHLIPAILQCSDPELAAHLEGTRPYFALSAALTLYAHDIQEYSDIARLYDFILAHEPVLTMYLFAALIISRRDEVLEIEHDDSDMLLFTLQKLPQPLDLQALIDRSLDIFRIYPPEKLTGPSWHKISSNSVLKTSRRHLREQNLDEARSLFKKQSQELAREEFTARVVKQVSRNRRPIMSFGATVLVGVLSYYLRKNGHIWALLYRLTENFYR